MTPALRLAFSLVLSLLLWLPTIPGALEAVEEPTDDQLLFGRRQEDRAPSAEELLDDALADVEGTTSLVP